MEKIKCTVSYDGTNYFGFQRQTNQRTIQGELERVLTIINKQPITIYGSGRTDAGVHALNQVFHFNTPLNLTEHAWERGMNGLLPDDIFIRKVEKVDRSFHARYSAKWKEYRYYINVGEYNPLKANYWYQHIHRNPLDIDRMKLAIKYFKGTHDFGRFTSGNRLPDTVRTIIQAELIERDELLELKFVGNGFLRGQVRVMVGTLLEIGEGKRAIETIEQLLNGQPGHAGRTAKPYGLYLYNVFYDEYKKG